MSPLCMVQLAVDIHVSVVLFDIGSQHSQVEGRVRKLLHHVRFNLAVLDVRLVGINHLAHGSPAPVGSVLEGDFHLRWFWIMFSLFFNRSIHVSAVDDTKGTTWPIKRMFLISVEVLWLCWPHRWSIFDQLIASAALLGLQHVLWCQVGNSCQQVEAGNMCAVSLKHPLICHQAWWRAKWTLFAW